MSAASPKRRRPAQESQEKVRSRRFFLGTYVALFVLPAVTCFFIIGTVELNIGDFLGSPVVATWAEQVGDVFIYLAVYAALFVYGKRLLAGPWLSGSPVGRPELVLAIVVACFAIDLFFYVVFGFGKAGVETSTSLSIFSTVMPKDIALTLLIYNNAHRPKRALLIMTGFTAFALSLGWTGQFFTLFVMALYLFRDILYRRKFLVLLIVVAGVATYPAIFSLKLGIRQGEAFQYNILNVVHLASRLSGYPALAYLRGEGTSFLSGYGYYFDNLTYLIEPFLAIIPKSILGLQGTITLEKAIVDYVGGNFATTQFIWGLPTKFWYFWDVGIVHFLLFCGGNALMFWLIYTRARRDRNEFLSFYLFLLLGLYVWNGDASTLFVSFVRVGVFFAFYRFLNLLMPVRRRRLPRPLPPSPVQPRPQGQMS